MMGLWECTQPDWPPLGAGSGTVPALLLSGVAPRRHGPAAPRAWAPSCCTEQACFMFKLGALLEPNTM